MRNIKLLIEYDGTNYCGWQIQPECETIQGIIESTLTRITKADTDVLGAGRTDAGVHALGQVANFRTDSKMTPDEFKIALNSLLPKDIAIKNVEEVDESFHSRYDAINRVYHYTISTTPSVFLRNNVYVISRQIDVDLMNTACEFLMGTHDFSSFSSASDPVSSMVRNIRHIRWYVFDSKCSVIDEGCKHRLIQLRIEANAFLRGMVRTIAGTLLDVGLGKIAPEKIIDILEMKDRSSAGPSLPAKGLCLVRVDY
jgi:tRNA pseudouridine38-40 synthase